jgi:hypothetical protein
MSHGAEQHQIGRKQHQTADHVIPEAS